MPPSNKNIAPKSFECFMEHPSPFCFIYYIQDSMLFSTNTEYSFPGLDLKLSNKALVTNPWEFYPPHSKRTTLPPFKCLSLSTRQRSVLGEYFVPLQTRYYSTPFAVAPQYWCHLENTRTADGVGLQSGDSPFSVRKEMRAEGLPFCQNLSGKNTTLQYCETPLVTPPSPLGQVILIHLPLHFSDLVAF